MQTIKDNYTELKQLKDQWECIKWLGQLGHSSPELWVELKDVERKVSELMETGDDKYPTCSLGEQSLVIKPEDTYIRKFQTTDTDIIVAQHVNYYLELDGVCESLFVKFNTPLPEGCTLKDVKLYMLSAISRHDGRLFDDSKYYWLEEGKDYKLPLITNRG